MTDTITAIDAALQAAKARKAAKGGGTAPTATETTATTTPRPAGKPRLTDEEKAARVEARAQASAARKQERETKRAAKLADRLANKAPAHLKKVQKAAERLGTLGETAQAIFNDATTNLTATEVACLAARLQHFNREQSTVRALGTKVEVGQNVTITGGDPKFVGLTGTVSRAARIRAYVTVDGYAKAIYVFSSDLTVNAVEQAQEAVNA